jgi:parallel beta-helix repeat protein
MINVAKKNFYIILITIFLILCQKGFTQGSNSYCFLFNGESSQLYVYDGQPANVDANQNGFSFFNSNSSNNQITVQAWIYLLGDTPTDVEVPIIYRTVNNGTTFYLYVKNNKGYFSVGNNNTATVNTTIFPAFQWISLTGSYDGSNLKIYLGGSFVASVPFSITPGYSVTNETTGLFVGKSNTGALKGLIDEIRIFNVALAENSVNSSGGNGNPAENIPSSLLQYLAEEWSFTGISSGNLLQDLSTYKNHLHINNITQIYQSKNLPFFVVTSTADDPDASIGDGSAASLNGDVTLRSALQETNSLAGEQIVYFYIPGIAPYTIQPGSALPDITDPVFLDGTTQHGYAGSPVLQTTGTYGGITITAGNSTINGLSLNSSSGYGLTLSSVGGNIISANEIGGVLINSSGNNINSNVITNLVGDGIDLSSGVSNNQISDNTISENNWNGISLTNTSGNSIKSNTISSNALNGVSVSSSNDTISGNTISGNSGVGISIVSDAGNLITNNTIGLNNSGGVLITNSTETLSGNTIIGNSGFGVSLITSNSSVSNNDISGNSSYGIVINGSNNLVENDSVYNNGAEGVYVQTGNHNSILTNSIYDNNTLGIKLNASANDSQQYPTLDLMYAWQDETALPQIKGGTAIHGILNSAPQTNFKIQFFANSSLANREGRRFIGEIETTTDIAGESDFVANLKDAVLGSTEVVSATATGLDNSSNPLNTSEFSPSIERNTDEGLHYLVNTTLAGIPLHWKDGISNYHIAASVPSEYISAIQNGFNTWSDLNQLHYTQSMV